MSFSLDAPSIGVASAVGQCQPSELPARPPVQPYAHARATRQADALAAALALSAAGWGVFPVDISGGKKKPCRRLWQYPAKGHTGHAADAATVRRWWGHGGPYAGSGVGIALRAAGAFAVDLDSADAAAAWAAMSEAGGGIGLTFTVHSTRGPKYLLRRDGSPVPLSGRGSNGTQQHRPEVAGADIVAGYVLAWAPGRSWTGSPADVAACPSWLYGPLAAVFAPPAAKPSDVPPADVRRAAVLTAYGRAALSSEALRVAETMLGERHAATVRAAFRLGQLAIYHGLDFGTVVAALVGACRTNGQIRDAGEPSVRRDIADGWRAGQAAPDNRGAGADGTAWAEHAAAVDAWATGAAAAVELTGLPRTRTSDCAVAAALADIARAAGPAEVVDASRHRLARLTGLSHTTCRVALVRLAALGVVELAESGGLRGFDVELGRARKAANGWRLRFVGELSAMPLTAAALAQPQAANALTESTAGAGDGPMVTTDKLPTNRRGPGQDALTAALTATGAAILRALLDAGGPLTAVELAAVVGCSRPTACQRAAGLVTHGVLRPAGVRVNANARPSPLFAAAVGSEAEAVGMLDAEATRAAVVARRADDWATMTEDARKRSADSYARAACAAAGVFRQPAPADVAELAAAVRGEPLTAGAIEFSPASSTRQAVEHVKARRGIMAGLPAAVGCPA